MRNARRVVTAAAVLVFAAYLIGAPHLSAERARWLFVWCSLIGLYVDARTTRLRVDAIENERLEAMRSDLVSTLHAREESKR